MEILLKSLFTYSNLICVHLDPVGSLDLNMLEIFLSPLGHAYSLDICTVINAYTAD